jgi:hypothetical protein
MATTASCFCHTQNTCFNPRLVLFFARRSGSVTPFAASGRGLLHTASPAARQSLQYVHDKPGKLAPRKIWVRLISARRQVEFLRNGVDCGFGLTQLSYVIGNQRFQFATLEVTARPLAA